MTFAATYEANVWAAVIAVCVLGIVALIVWTIRRGGRFTSPVMGLDVAKFDSMASDLAEVKVTAKSIDQAVNNKPTSEQPIKVHAEQAASHSGEAKDRVIALEQRVERVEDIADDNRTMTRHLVGDMAEVKAALNIKKKQTRAQPTRRTR